MARVGVISIDLIANVGKMLAPVRKAVAAIGGLRSGISATLGKMANIAAPLTAMATGFLSVAYAVSKVKEAFTEIDELSKVADRLGMTTERISGLQYAADLAGISMDELTKSLEYMMRQGFSTTQLEQMADKMQAMASDTERMQFAVATFGRGGAKMVNLLRGGSAALRDSVAEAKKFGVTFDRMSGAEVELANDSITRLNYAVKGLARTFAIDLAPSITVVTMKMAEFLAVSNSATEGSSRGVGRITGMIVWSLDVMDSWLDMWYGLQFTVERVEASVARLMSMSMLNTGPIADFWSSFADEIDLSAKEWYDKIFNRDRMAHSFMKGINESVKRAREAIQGVMPDALSGTDRLNISAVERGSQEAFKAILDTTKASPIEQQQLDAQKRAAATLDLLAKRGVVLYGANLT